MKTKKLGGLTEKEARLGDFSREGTMDDLFTLNIPRDDVEAVRDLWDAAGIPYQVKKRDRRGAVCRFPDYDTVLKALDVSLGLGGKLIHKLHRYGLKNPYWEPR